MKRINPFLKIAVMLIGGIAGCAVMTTIQEAGRNKSHLATQATRLSRDVENMNKKLPMMLDEETRLDRVAADSSQTTYFFCLPNLTKTNLELSILEKTLHESCMANFKTNSKLAVDRANNASMKYQYKDKNGEFLFEFSVSAKDF